MRTSPPLPHILALPLQEDMLPRQSSAVHADSTPPLSVLLQGRVKQPLLTSAVRAYAPLL